MSNIVKVLEHYKVDLDGDGKCCCPFPGHDENTPSFQYYDETDSYYCWGRCSSGGDSIELVRTMEPELTFKEAVAATEEILGAKVELSTSESRKRSKKPSEEPPALPMEVLLDFMKRTEYQDVLYRGIRKETDEFYKTRSVVKNGKVTQRFYIETNVDGAISGAKCRNTPKDFTYGKLGVTGNKNQLSGQFKYTAGGKYILIVGGEDDKSAGYQMFLDYQRERKQESYDVCAVVSPTAGEGSAAKQCAAQYDFLDGYDNIIIGMDNDKAGREATKAMIEVLPKEKLKVVLWSLNDPHAMLENKSKQFIRDFYNAKEITNTGIKSSVQAMEGVREFLTAVKITLPPQLHKVEAAMRGGIKSSGCIGNIIADTSIGKSLLSDTCIYHWILQCDIVPIIVSIERTASELTADMLSMHLSKNLVWFKDGQDAVDYLDREDVKELYQDLITDEYGKPRYHIIDERDGKLETLQTRMESAASKYDASLFVIDPLTDIIRSLGLDGQENHMMWQKYKKKEGWKIINVLHSRKPGNDKDGKTRLVTEYDCLGSGSIIQSADWNWVLNRDKMADDPIEKNTMRFDMPKCRGGTTGHITDLYYDPETRRQYDKDDYFNVGCVEPIGEKDITPVKTEVVVIQSKTNEEKFETF